MLALLGATGVCCGSSLFALTFVDLSKPRPVPREEFTVLSASEALDPSRAPIETIVAVTFVPDLALASEMLGEPDQLIVADRSEPRLVAHCASYEDQSFCEAARAYLSSDGSSEATAAFDRPWTLRARLCEPYSRPFHCAGLPRLALSQLAQAAHVQGGLLSLRILDLRDGPDEPVPFDAEETRRAGLVMRGLSALCVLLALALVSSGVLLSRRKPA